MSPLVAFVNLITMMGQQRADLYGCVANVEDAHLWMLQDLAMMTSEKLVIGIRSPWVRRVALPIYKAQQALTSTRGSKTEQALAALEILQQCTNDELRERCARWIRDTYHVA